MYKIDERVQFTSLHMNHPNAVVNVSLIDFREATSVLFFQFVLKMTHEQRSVGCACQILVPIETPRFGHRTSHLTQTS